MGLIAFMPSSVVMYKILSIMGPVKVHPDTLFVVTSKVLNLLKFSCKNFPVIISNQDTLSISPCTLLSIDVSAIYRACCCQTTSSSHRIDMTLAQFVGNSNDNYLVVMALFRVSLHPLFHPFSYPLDFLWNDLK